MHLFESLTHMLPAMYDTCHLMSADNLGTKMKFSATGMCKETRQIDIPDRVKKKKKSIQIKLYYGDLL